MAFAADGRMEEMMNWLINTAVKLSGAGKVWGWLDGKKTYGAAILGILGALLGLGTELAPLLGAHDAAALLAWVKHLPTCQSWLSLVASFGLLGLGHKVGKAAEAVQVGVVPPRP